MSAATPGESTTHRARPGTTGRDDHEHDSLRIEWRPPGGEPIAFAIDDPRDEGSVVLRRGRPPQRRDAFTRRQEEILRLVGEGLGNGEIAATLGISRRTVEKHLEAIHMKAQTTSRARLVAFAAARSTQTDKRNT